MYNSNIHHRRSIRLKGYDYSQAGLYFITICVKDRKCLFGKVAGESPAGVQMELNELGSVAYQQWQKLPERFTNIELDVFQIMPNHMHGIIVLTDFVGAGFTPAPNTTNTPAQNNTNTPDHDDAIAQNITNTPTHDDVVAHDDNAIADETWAGFTPAQNTTNTPDQNNTTNTPDHDDAIAQNITNTPTHDDVVSHDDNAIADYHNPIAGNDNPITDKIWAGASPAPTAGNSKSVGDIVGAYKSLVANDCLKIFKQIYPGKIMGKLWQRNYYEHIIRNEQSYQRISDYIINNPLKWNDDKFYTD